MTRITKIEEIALLALAKRRIDHIINVLYEDCEVCDLAIELIHQPEHIDRRKKCHICREANLLRPCKRFVNLREQMMSLRYDIRRKYREKLQEMLETNPELVAQYSRIVRETLEARDGQ